MPTSLCTKAIPAVHSVSPSCCPALGSDHYLCVLSVPSLLSHELPAQTRAQRCFPIVEDWCPVLVSAQESLVRWACVVQQCLQSEPGGAARHSLQMNNLFSQFCNILWNHARPPDRDTRRPLPRQPRWWTNECFRALVGCYSAWRAYRRSGSLSNYFRFSHSRLLFHRLVRSSRRAFWRRWQHNIQQIHNRNPELVRVRSDVVSVFPHLLRPPLWLGCQAWTIPPNSLPASATDGGRISRLWPLPRTPITPWTSSTSSHLTSSI